MRKSRRNRVPNLPMGMPLSGVEAEPIWVRVEARCLAYRHNSRVGVMDRPRGGKAAVVSAGTCTKRVGLAIWIKSPKAAWSVLTTTWKQGEALSDFCRVFRPACSRDHVFVPFAWVLRHVRQSQ